MGPEGGWRGGVAHLGGGHFRPPNAFVLRAPFWRDFYAQGPRWGFRSGPSELPVVAGLRPEGYRVGDCWRLIPGLQAGAQDLDAGRFWDQLQVTSSKMEDQLPSKTWHVGRTFYTFCFSKWPSRLCIFRNLT
ncbi:hypothetical protein NDU88_002208 [Pleurodeles waltl]|uniref:Uncharacterized protein n=1 Tax=Pleurodeles waltl TaxID=8319 RepID=A0AAV7MNY5_PLEWA|nr:hypothetical protein NDU88_002208 [Pleurodeles waltl]